MSWEEIREILSQVRAVCAVEPLSVETHDQAVQLAHKHGFPSTTP